MSSQAIADIRAAIAGRIVSWKENVAAVVAPAPIGFSGKPVTGGKAIGYLFDSDMGIDPDEEVKALAKSWKASGLRGVVGPNPTGILAWRDGDGIRAFLYATHVDTTGTHPVDVFLMEGCRAGWMGSLVVTRREILEDGSMGPVAEQATGRFPGAGVSLDLPDGVPLANVLGMALENLSLALTFDNPSTGQTEAWMAANPDAKPDGAAEIEARARVLRTTPPKGDEPARPRASPPPKLRVDLGKLAERLEALHRPVYIPVMREVRDGDANAVSGRPGLAFIPEGTPWPEAKGQTLRQVAQFDVASLPVEAAELLGGKGLFQFFVGADYDEHNGAWLARVVDPTAPGSWQAGPEDAEAPRAVITGWERRIEAPHSQDLVEGPTALVGRRIPEAMLDALDFLGPDTCGQPRLPPEKVAEAAILHGADPALAERVAAAAGHHDGNKLLGWPTWAQGPEWQGAPRKPMRFLFQFELGEPFSGMGLATDVLASDGHAQVFVSEDGKRRFGFAWACG